MNQEEREIFLLHALLEESPAYASLTIPKDPQKRRQLLRSLLNVRSPMQVSERFLEVQDAYLKTLVKERGIVDVASFKPTAHDSRLFLWQGDITRLNSDAIVNAANSALLGCFIPCHPCIDNLVHTLAGVQLRLACHKIMAAQGHEETVGQAKLTPAFNLPSRYVIHTVGPMIQGMVTKKDCEFLASCYRSCLELASAHKIHSLAFCCISTGVFHFPQKLASRIAVETVDAFLKEDTTLEKVIFNVYKDEDYQYYQELLER